MKVRFTEEGEDNGFCMKQTNISLNAADIDTIRSMANGADVNMSYMTRRILRAGFEAVAKDLGYQVDE